MRVVHISSADIRGGGARSVYRMHRAMLQASIDSKMFVKHKYSQDEEVIQYQPKADYNKGLLFKIQRRKATGGLGYLLKDKSPYNGFAPPASPFGLHPFHQLPEADIVSLNWVAGFWDYQLVPRLLERAKAVVWRFSDMQPFTGGCFYDAGCGRFKQTCGECPALEGISRKDPSRRFLKLKTALIQRMPKSRIHVIAQSRWIKEEIESSPVFRGVKVHHIANGIDLHAFKPMDKMQSRKTLGIGSDKKVILYVSQQLDNPRKGALEFKAAMKELASMGQRNLLILALGQDQLPEINGVQVMQLDHVKGSEALSQCYSAADLYAIYSSQDNLPNTVLEAMACSRPTVGSAVGGIKDQVVDGESGRLIDYGDLSGFAQACFELLNDPTKIESMGQKARERAETHFEIDQQMKRYIQLYESILSEHDFKA